MQLRQRLAWLGPRIGTGSLIKKEYSFPLRESRRRAA